MMGRPKLYFTEEERRAARRRTVAKYDASEKGRASTARANASPLATLRYARYRETEGYRAAQERFKESGGRNRLATEGRARVIEQRPELLQAWNAVQVALRQGALIRPDACETCGRSLHLVAHHHLGYEPEHRLDVQWLCRRCHKAAHQYAGHRVHAFVV